MSIANQHSGRKYAGLKQEERTAQRRQKFIDAGIQVIGTDGYHSTTVRKLCSQAELTARYYYESFTSTEDLLIAAFDQCMGRISQKIMSAIMQNASDLEPLVLDVLHAYFKEMEDKRVARLITLEILGVSENVDQFSNKRLQKMGSLILQIGHHFYPNWQVDPDEGSMICVSLLGAMRQATLHWMANDYLIERDKVVTATSVLVFGLIKMIEEQPPTEPGIIQNLK